MSKGIGTTQNRETAYRVYALFGGRNIKQILGRLEWKHDLKISAQTLYKWREAGRWEERMASSAEHEVMTFNERMLGRVLGRVLGLIRKYDAHFAGGGPGRDAQAAYAYTNLIRTAMELERRMNRWESADPVAAGPEPGEGHTTTVEDGAPHGGREKAGAFDLGA